MDLGKALDAIFNFVTEHGITTHSMITLGFVACIVILCYYFKNKFKLFKNKNKQSGPTTIRDNNIIVTGNNNIVNDTKTITKIAENKIAENNRKNPQVKIVDGNGNVVDSANHTIVYELK